MRAVERDFGSYKCQQPSAEIVRDHNLSETGLNKKVKSLILAQIERWRHALHMQVERQRGATWRRVANG